MSWNTVSIGDICDVKGGKRLPKGHGYSPTPTPYRYIRVTDINDGKIDVATLKYLYPVTQEKIHRYIVNKGDVIISIAGTIGVTVPVTNDMDGINLTENAAKLVPKEKGIYDPYYFSLALQSPHVQNQISGFTGQVTIGKLALFRIKKIQIPLPPLAEQQRIAAILDKADALRAQRRTALAKLDTLLQATFLHMFGDPVTNPMNWEVGILGDVVFSAKDGPHVSPKYSEEGVPFLSTRHIRPGKIFWKDLKYISFEEAKIHWKKCKPELGDILYTKGGTTGFAKAIDFHKDFAIWVHIALLKTNQEKVDPLWLENMLNTQYCYAQSQRFTRGIANRDLGLTRMIKIKLYIPPLEKQKEFSNKIRRAKSQHEYLKLHANQLDDLFHSLQQRAFKGEL